MNQELKDNTCPECNQVNPEYKNRVYRGEDKSCPDCEKACHWMAFSCWNCGHPFAPYFNYKPIIVFDCTTLVLLLACGLATKGHIELANISASFGGAIYVTSRLVTSRWFKKFEKLF